MQSSPFSIRDLRYNLVMLGRLKIAILLLLALLFSGEANAQRTVWSSKITFGCTHECGYWKNPQGVVQWGSLGDTTFDWNGRSYEIYGINFNPRTNFVALGLKSGQSFTQQMMDLLIFHVSVYSFPLRDARFVLFDKTALWENPARLSWPGGEVVSVRITERTPLIIKGDLRGGGRRLSVEVDEDRLQEENSRCRWHYWNPELGAIDGRTRGYINHEEDVVYTDGSVCGTYTIKSEDEGAWFVVTIGNDWSEPVGPVEGSPSPSSPSPSLSLSPLPESPETEEEPEEEPEEEIEELLVEASEGGCGIAPSGKEPRLAGMFLFLLLFGCWFLKHPK